MDVDAGIDDAIAIITALQSPEIEIVGITTTSGNVSARAAARNTLRILQAIRGGLAYKIPVMAGSSRPLSKQLVHAEYIHGKGGLGDVQLEYDKSFLRHGNVARFIPEILRNYRKKEVSMIATAPLTNVAKSIVAAADIDLSIIDYLSRICIMGGAYGFATKDLYGNITHHAEFNFYCDPAAAQIVMNSGARIDVVGLDVTSRYLVNDKFIARLLLHGSKKSKASKIVSQLLQYPLKKFGQFDLPDVFAVAMFERPDMFEFKRGQIEIVQEGKLWGHSRFTETNGESGTFVVSKILDEKCFDEYIISRLK